MTVVIGALNEFSVILQNSVLAIMLPKIQIQRLVTFHFAISRFLWVGLGLGLRLGLGLGLDNGKRRSGPSPGDWLTLHFKDQFTYLLYLLLVSGQ